MEALTIITQLVLVLTLVCLAPMLLEAAGDIVRRESDNDAA